MSAVYNEIEPYAADWLRNLIAAGHIAPGEVDTRSIEDVHPDDYRKFTQVHLFAGIGIWSHALRRIGWPDDQPIWSASCPCQPFSAAGKSGGFTDERHLWPAVFHLVTHLRPVRIVGEQVASADGLAWLDLVLSDLEGADYAPGAIPFPAAGVGAPELRDRLYWMADAHHAFGGPGASFRYNSDRQDTRRAQSAGDAERRGGANGMACGEAHGLAAGTGQQGLEDRRWPISREERQALKRASRKLARRLGTSNMGDADVQRWSQQSRSDCWPLPERRGAQSGADLDRRGDFHIGEPAPGPVNGFWRIADWLFGRDGKWRPVEPSTFPLVNGYPCRVGKLRAYGNAIVAPAAEAFLKALRELDLAHTDEES